MAPRRGNEPGADEAGAIRAFIAIALDDPVRRALAAIVRTLRTGPGGDGVRWVRPENLHVTLRFLGQTDPARIPAIVQKLRAAVSACPSLALQLGAVGGFPSPRRPRVIACEVGPEKSLVELAEVVEGAVTQAGCEPEARRFRAHLTLGRISGRLSKPVTAAVTAVGEAWLVNEIVLYRSRLTSSGATHTPLERIALGGSNHP